MGNCCSCKFKCSSACWKSCLCPCRKQKELSWREQVALEKKQVGQQRSDLTFLNSVQRRLDEAKEKKELEKQTKKEEKISKKRAKLEDKRMAPVGRNGLTWAEKESRKKTMDLKHLDKWQRLHYARKRTRRRDVQKETWSGYVNLKTRPFGLWLRRFIVVQGHFLYVFRRDKPKSKLRRVVLLKKAEIKPIGLFHKHYYVIIIDPGLPHHPFINKARPNKSLRDGTITFACINLKVQEGLVKELQKTSRARYGGLSADKQKEETVLDLSSASTGGLKLEKHIKKWRQMSKQPPSIAALGLVDMADWLEREGSLTNPWVKRYIILKGHWLYEFLDTMPSSRAKRIVFLANAKVTNNKFANNGFNIHSVLQRNPDKLGSEDKTYALQCTTLAMRKKWETMVKQRAEMLHAGQTKRRLKKVDVGETLSPVVDLFQYGI